MDTMENLLNALNILKQSEEWKNVIDAVMDCVDEGKTIDSPEVQRELDDLALTTAWAYDTTNGKLPDSRGSVTKKIRKALGYSY